MKNKDIHITYITKPSLQLQTCQVVFISKSTKKTLALYLAQTATKPIFTISDIHGFAKSGGIVEITRRNSRLGFIFNMKSIQQSGLNIAAPLLRMSQRIEEENKHD
ncbi:MAG: YfiR family protein [Bacteroidales bacterium]|nr:YfiR family protein [Bacteroidales bacterium]